MLRVLIFATLCVLVAQAQKGPLVNLGQQAGFYQGDIQLSSKNRNAILRAKRWTDGIVYYDLGNQWDKDQLAMIKEGMAAIEASTCVRFKPRKDEPNYVIIRNTQGGCFSTGAGMQGGVQQISLRDDQGSSCFSHGIIVHELLHCVGLWHEQSRYDRDEHITIHWENLSNSTTIRYQFRKIPESESNTYGIPYNYLSIMHYDAFTAAMNGGITMEPKDKAYLYEIGNQAYGHELDWEKVRRIYECKDTYTPAPTTPAPCVDYIDYCDQYLDRCGQESWMVSSCRKSCGFCRGMTPLTPKPTTASPHPRPTEEPRPTQPLKCEDEISYCTDYAHVCGKEGWTERACRKTCRLC